MRRRLFTILSAVSLVLCLALAVLWPLHSRQRVSRIVDWHTSFPDHRYLQCGFSSAGVLVFREILQGSKGHYSSYTFLGFRYVRGDVQLASVSYTFSQLFVVPWWFLCAVTAALPTIWLWRYRRDRRRLSDGMPHCAKCDYNLTGNVSGICPECGTAVEPQAKQEEIDREETMKPGPPGEGIYSPSE